MKNNGEWHHMISRSSLPELLHKRRCPELLHKNCCPELLHKKTLQNSRENTCIGVSY